VAYTSNVSNLIRNVSSLVKISDEDGEEVTELKQKIKQQISHFKRLNKSHNDDDNDDNDDDDDDDDGDNDNDNNNANDNNHEPEARANIWNEEIEQAFIEATLIYPVSPLRQKILHEDEKLYGRNEMISNYIFQKTGVLRTRKQVSSHTQQMRKKIALTQPVGANNVANNSNNNTNNKKKIGNNDDNVNDEPVPKKRKVTTEKKKAKNHNIKEDKEQQLLDQMTANQQQQPQCSIS